MPLVMSHNADMLSKNHTLRIILLKMFCSGIKYKDGVKEGLCCDGILVQESLSLSSTLLQHCFLEVCIGQLFFRGASFMPLLERKDPEKNREINNSRLQVCTYAYLETFVGGFSLSLAQTTCFQNHIYCLINNDKILAVPFSKKDVVFCKIREQWHQCHCHLLCS